MARKFLAAVLVIAAFLCINVSAVSLEQVQPVMPDISVFVHSDGQDFQSVAPSDITATLDGEALTVGDFALSDEGIYYVFMLDISRSISDSYLEAAKQAVLDTYNQMRTQDQLAVITFGDNVNIVVDGSESAEEVSQELAGIKCTDNNTCFYDAMNTLVETASAKADMRHVAVIVSDGVEDTDRDVSQTELEQNLRNGGVAVYALAVDSTPGENLETFRKFVEVSGGELFEFSPTNAKETLGKLLTQIDEIWRLNLTASSNAADGQPHTLEIKFGELGTVTTEISPTSSQADTTPPYIVSLTTDTSAGTITVVFSEAMGNLDRLDCYKLNVPSGSAPALTVASCEGNTVVLSAQGLSIEKGWTLSFTGLTDASAEKNVLPDCTVPLAGLNSDANQSTAPVQQDAFPLIWIIVAAVVVVALVVVLFIVKKKQKAKGGDAPKTKEKREKKPRTKGDKKLSLKKKLKDKKSDTQAPHFVFSNVDDSADKDKKDDGEET